MVAPPSKTGASPSPIRENSTFTPTPPATSNMTSQADTSRTLPGDIYQSMDEALRAPARAIEEQAIHLLDRFATSQGQNQNAEKARAATSSYVQPSQSSTRFGEGWADAWTKMPVANPNAAPSASSPPYIPRMRDNSLGSTLPIPAPSALSAARSFKNPMKIIREFVASKGDSDALTPIEATGLQAVLAEARNLSDEADPTSKPSTRPTRQPLFPPSLTKADMAVTPVGGATLAYGQPPGEKVAVFAELSASSAASPGHQGPAGGAMRPGPRESVRIVKPWYMRPSHAASSSSSAQPPASTLPGGRSTLRASRAMRLFQSQHGAPLIPEYCRDAAWEEERVLRASGAHVPPPGTSAPAIPGAAAVVPATATPTPPNQAGKTPTTYTSRAANQLLQIIGDTGSARPAALAKAARSDEDGALRLSDLFGESGHQPSPAAPPKEKEPMMAFNGKRTVHDSGTHFTPAAPSPKRPRALHEDVMDQAPSWLGESSSGEDEAEEEEEEEEGESAYLEEEPVAHTPQRPLTQAPGLAMPFLGGTPRPPAVAKTPYPPSSDNVINIISSSEEEDNEEGHRPMQHATSSGKTLPPPHAGGARGHNLWAPVEESDEGEMLYSDEEEAEEEEYSSGGEVEEEEHGFIPTRRELDELEEEELEEEEEEEEEELEEDENDEEDNIPVTPPPHHGIISLTPPAPISAPFGLPVTSNHPSLSELEGPTTSKFSFSPPTLPSQGSERERNLVLAEASPIPVVLSGESDLMGSAEERDAVLHEDKTLLPSYTFGTPDSSKHDAQAEKRALEEDTTTLPVFSF